MQQIDASIQKGIQKLNLGDDQTAMSSFDQFSLDKRSMSNEDERKIEESDSRNSAELSFEGSSIRSGSIRSIPRSTPEKNIWRCDTCMWREEEVEETPDDISVFSGYSYASTATTGTTDSSVHDIISRLQSETDRRRRRLLRRRSSRATNAKLKNYIQRSKPRPENPGDCKVGITVEIKE